MGVVDIRGWVYIIENQGMPGLVKVGYSAKDPWIRAAELASTGAPHPYSVSYDVLVIDPRSVEKAAHSILADRREGKEWFRCSVSEAIRAIRSTAAQFLLESEPPVESERQNIHPRVGMPCGYPGCGAVSIGLHRDFAYCNRHLSMMRKMRPQP